MKKERLFLALSLLFFLTLLAVVLSTAPVSATVEMGLNGSPLFLAPPLPTPTPAPLPPGFSFPQRDDAAAMADRPDLIVEKIEVVPATPYVFNRAEVRVTIMNIGSGEIPGEPGDHNFFTDLYIRDAGVPDSGERGITCLSGSCEYPDAGFSVQSVLPWGCQDFWVKVPGARYVLTATVVFTGVKSYYIYAQIDTPEEGFPTGHVAEDPAGGENNNIYPTDSSVWAQVKAPFRFTENTHRAFFENYASSLEVIPETRVLTDINGSQIVADSKLTLGIFEEPPLDWGTAGSPPDFTSADYNVLNPDTRLNGETLRDQSKPVIATSGLITQSDVVVVWQDHRHSTHNPDIYLRWSYDQVEVSPGRYRQNWDPASTHEFRVNDDADPTHAAQRNPAVAVAPNGDVVVVWEDNRLNPGSMTYSDIYLQQYRFVGGVLTPVGGNVRVEPPDYLQANETHPDIAVGLDGTFYVVWQSHLTNQSAIWGIKGKAPNPGDPIAWGDPLYVVDPSGHEKRNPRIDVSATTVISITRVDVTDPDNPIVYFDLLDRPVAVVTWHDNRGFAPGGCSNTGEDVWVTYSDDNFVTFAEDQRVNSDCRTETYRRTQDQPTVTVTQDKVDMTIYAQGIPVELENVPVPSVHVAWRDFRNSTGEEPGWSQGNDPDIYYAYCPFLANPNPPYDLRLTVGPNVKINQNDTFSWQTSPPKQLNPDITGYNYTDLDNQAREIPYDVYLVWADGRNYDNRNYDIYMWLYGDNFPEKLTGHNLNVNGNAKNHGFDEAFFGEDYRDDHPPAAWQMQPSVAVNLEHDEALIRGGYVHVAWADSRLSPVGAANDNEVFYTRTNLTFFANYDLYDYGVDCGGLGGYGAGAFISRAFDACPTLAEGEPCDDVTWFKIDYGGVTPSGTWMGLQTRVADTLADLLSAEWWPQSLAAPGPCGIPIRGYLGPGADMQQGGSRWPTGRYAQYRVNFWTRDSRFSPDVYYATLFYGRASFAGAYGNIYLPYVVKAHVP